jgi:hypothetical protein
MSRLIPIDKIDPSPWARLFPHDEEHITRLAEDIEERGVQTPLHVYPTGARFQLLAGHDRLDALRRNGETEAPCEERSTLSSEDARFEYFCKDNTLRKDVDKRALAKAALARYPDWSDRRLALLVGCSNTLVGHVRTDAVSDGTVSTVDTRTGVDGVQQPATKPARTDPAANGTTPPAAKQDTPPKANGKPAPAEPDHGYGEDDMGGGEDELTATQQRLADTLELVESLTTDDTARELRKKCADYAALRALKMADERELHESRKDATYAKGMLTKIRGALEVEKDSEIIPAIRELKATAIA